MIHHYEKLKESRILVTGGRGFLGKYVLRLLDEIGVKNENLFTFGSSDYDLRRIDEAFKAVKKIEPDIILNLAARLGGIGDNRNFPASYFYDNLQIGINIIEAARLCGVKKLVNIGTVCSYPKNSKVPFQEKNLWDGFPEETNGSYGVAKRATIVYSQAVEKQYGFKTVNLVLTNLYGPEDDFRDSTSHVIPAIIKKILKAKENGIPFFDAWGDGSPSRDFLFVGDAARAVVLAAACCKISDPINVGSGMEVCIKDLINDIVELLDYQGTVNWRKEFPNGQPRRVLDTTKAKEHFYFEAEEEFRIGLRKTINWYIKNKCNVDQLKSKFKDLSPHKLVDLEVVQNS